MPPVSAEDPAAHLKGIAVRLKSELAEGQSALKTAYEARGNAQALLRGRCQLVDEVLTLSAGSPHKPELRG